MNSNDEKTDVILIYAMANVIKILLPLGVYADSKHFPKNSSFFTISFDQANDVYVKIYETRS
jgi:hypothetical protein